MEKDIIEILLKDHSTDKHIIWASDGNMDELQAADILLLRPRHLKTKEEKKTRTKEKAEVFTPSWVCKNMNNMVWERYEKENKSWQEKVETTMLEITCGEAPFLVSRYDATTGEDLPLEKRIGLLDKKMRLVNLYAGDEWSKWARTAFQTTYGYEYQGDNIFLARKNLLMTYVDYYKAKWGKKPSLDEQKEIAEIIAWNIFQMDGLKSTTPSGVKAKIFDWKENHEIFFGE